jgi:hypothetical protein
MGEMKKPAPLSDCPAFSEKAWAGVRVLRQFLLGFPFDVRRFPASLYNFPGIRKGWARRITYGRRRVWRPK